MRMERKRSAVKLKAEVKQQEERLKAMKRKVQEAEGRVACRHHAKSFTLEMLGKGATAQREKVKAMHARMELLDRIKDLGSGLSPGQKNDWEWFRGAWDREMAARHGDDWPEVFAGIVQNTIDSEESNALSKLMYAESTRISQNTLAVGVPSM